MIKLTRLNGAPLVVNAFLIEHLEATPDTIISLTNGRHFVVRESVDQVIAQSVEYLGSLRDRGVDPRAVGQLGRVKSGRH
jgi:flagellar protein FlbD